MDENKVENLTPETADTLIDIADLQKMVLYMEFADGAECTMPLTARQAALVVYVLGLTLVDDIVVGYSDERLEELFSARKQG